MTRKPIFLALVLVAAALALILRPPAAPYLALLRQGDAHAARAERTAAVTAYEEAARLQPDEPAPYLRLAQVCLDWGRTDEALTALAEAERLSAEEDSVSLERLWVAAYTARADWLAVAEHARRLLALAPADQDARHTLAQTYLELQEWDAARSEYEALLRADSADSVAHERLGALLLGADPAAIQHLYAARTDMADRLLAAMQQPGAASDPAYASALVGRVLFEAREWALAVRQFERALLHNPDYPDAHAHLGYALERMGHLDEAGPHLLRAVELAPDSTVAHTFLGLYYERQGDLSAARAEYEAAYDLDPTNPAVCIEIGQTWAAEGQYAVAETWLRQAIALQPDDPAVREILARFYLDHNITAMGQGTEAATQLLGLEPDDARAHDLRGWAALQVGDIATARDSLMQAIALDPMLASAYYHLGLLRSAQGDPQRAAEAFTRALDLDTTGELTPLIERAIEAMP